mgnify:CR=1 FL=1
MVELRGSTPNKELSRSLYSSTLVHLSNGYPLEHIHERKKSIRKLHNPLVASESWYSCILSLKEQSLNEEASSPICSDLTSTIDFELKFTTLMRLQTCYKYIYRQPDR